MPACFCPECRAVVPVHDWKGHKRRCSGTLKLLGVGDAMPVTGVGPTCDECNVRPVWKVEDGKRWCSRCWYLMRAFR